MQIKIPPLEDLMRELGATWFPNVPDLSALDESTRSEMTLRLRAQYLSQEARKARREREPEKAIQLILQSLTIEHSLQNEAGIASDLGNLGALYFDIRQLDKAENTLKHALDMDERAGREIDVAVNLYWLGQVEIRKKRLDEAHRLVERSYHILSACNHGHVASVKEPGRMRRIILSVRVMIDPREE